MKALERRLESVLGELAENVPPKYEEDEAIEITLSMLVVSGELLRQSARHRTCGRGGPTGHLRPR